MKRLALAALILFGGEFGAALAEPHAPQTLVIVACRVDDLTGTRTPPGDPGSVVMPSKDWRDLELHIAGGEYQCKREQVDLVDKVAAEHPDQPELTPNLGSIGGCARVGMQYASEWDKNNPGWAVVAIGCPTPVVNEQGAVVGWALPSCPTYLPGTNNRMKCRFDSSVI